MRYRLKDVLPFGKPQAPTVAISRDFYLSVLGGRAAAPTLLQLMNPGGQGGAVDGLAAPLAKDAGKDALARPIERGVYALASRDQKTVLKMRVFSKEEAGFDPEPILRHADRLGIHPEAAVRIAATWTLFQLTWESFDPETDKALDFISKTAHRLAELTDGVIADPVSRRYLLPDPARVSAAAAPSDVREHVRIGTRTTPNGTAAFTLGLTKFSHPEFEIDRLVPSDAAAAEVFLLGLGQSVLRGHRFAPGDRVGSEAAPIQVVAGGHDRAQWDGVPCLDLLPDRSLNPTDALAAWQTEAQESR
jgi:hypothetical protein